LLSDNPFANRSHRIRIWGVPMRDIRDDLKERLSSLEERVVQLQENLKVIEDESSVIMRLLDYEDHRFATVSDSAADPQSETRSLSDLMNNELNGRTAEAFTGRLFQ
jgi:hypothetical protein